MVRLALLAMLLVACERGRPRGAGEGTAEADTTRADTSVRAIAQPRAACPATGNWSECAIYERLDRAGLAPRRDSAAVTEPPLTVRGVLLRVGASQLELYFYPDAKAREAEEAKLDRTKYVDYAAPLTIRQEPTLIHSANLIAILHSPNDHQRERVADAITAGPPQP
jgi:hypothetical protein